MRAALQIYINLQSRPGLFPAVILDLFLYKSFNFETSNKREKRENINVSEKNTYSLLCELYLSWVILKL